MADNNSSNAINNGKENQPSDFESICVSTEHGLEIYCRLELLK